jgi:hypothetical protein
MSSISITLFLALNILVAIIFASALIFLEQSPLNVAVATLIYIPSIVVIDRAIIMLYTGLDMPFFRLSRILINVKGFAKYLQSFLLLSTLSIVLEPFLRLLVKEVPQSSIISLVLSTVLLTLIGRIGLKRVRSSQLLVFLVPLLLVLYMLGFVGDYIFAYLDTGLRLLEVLLGGG